MSNYRRCYVPGVKIAPLPVNGAGKVEKQLRIITLNKQLPVLNDADLDYERK